MQQFLRMTRMFAKQKFKQARRVNFYAANNINLLFNFKYLCKRPTKRFKSFLFNKEAAKQDGSCEC